MILSNAPQNEAVLSNVGEIGDFKIKASAKAFSILSSGLYANKIRAIIRELSCNAVDSHVAAGKQETPFDVHLPNTLEPWFAIRDYGTGLSHEQVTQIYTTYFESTKTASNEFIGALGLGSKSPFSYTDNFTVTAIQSGKKGIYSAFINGEGVPSIALMMTEETSEPAGVEVKFSVNDRYDFSKFRDEARGVYTYFKLRPVVSGSAEFKFFDVEYDTKDIIPGVHGTNSSRTSSLAVMGNIAYPIQIPEADKSLGELRPLLSCGLEMHFAIGELDFQASREGLSYIPSTIDSIKRKLVAVNDQLMVHLAKEADAIPNLWDRAIFLHKKRDNSLWGAAVAEYAAKAKLPTYDADPKSWTKLISWNLEVSNLASKYNIALRGLAVTRSAKNVHSLKSNNEHIRGADGSTQIKTVWRISVDADSHFIINDLKTGAGERAKYHYRESEKDVYSRSVYVLDPVDKSRKMNVDGFFAEIAEPPTTRRFLASSLKEKPRKDNSLGKNVTILALEQKGYGGYYTQKEMVWRDAGKADSFDANKTYYYLPLSGFIVNSVIGHSFDVKRFYADLKDCGVSSLTNITVYGVRKSDIEFIQTQKNWINLENHIAKELSAIDNKLTMSLVLQAVDNFNLCQYNSNIVEAVTNPASPYVKLVNQFKGFDKIRYSEQSLKNLCRMYAKNVTFNPQDTVEKFEEQCKVVYQHYPLLAYLRSAPNEKVAEYINLIDTQKGV
jgi:hypothetical protein